VAAVTKKVGRILQVERIDQTIRRRSWYKKAAWRQRKGCIIVVVLTAAMALLGSLLLYHVAKDIPGADHFPTKSTRELLETLRPQIVRPLAE